MEWEPLRVDDEKVRSALIYFSVIIVRWMPSRKFCKILHYKHILEYAQPPMGQFYPFKLSKFAGSPRIRDAGVGMLTMTRSVTLETLRSLEGR